MRSIIGDYLNLHIKHFTSMNLCFSRFVFFLLMTLVCYPSETYARKKNKHRNNLTAYIVEPDALAAKAKQEGCVLPILAVNLHQTERIQSRYREGIDVSHYQGHIDWDQVAGSAKISYVYLKATEGATYVDDTYARNLNEVRRVGLSVGSYHFYRPNVSWREQLQNLTSIVKLHEQDLVPIIDIEHRGRVSDKQFLRDLKQFVHHVERYYGKKPLLYSYQNFYNKHLKGHFTDYHWMIAKYQESEPILEDGHDYIMWQYTQAGSMPGVKGNVDRSCIMGGFELYQIQL